MSKIADIKRILWHEIGHLCINILMCEEHSWLKINSFQIVHEFHPEALFEWSGFSETTPKLSTPRIIDDSSLFSYALIRKLSGCVFETIFMNRIIGDNPKKFKDCFAHKDDSLGRIDKNEYLEILQFAYIKHYNFNYEQEVKVFFEKELPTILSESIANYTKCNEDLDELIGKEALKIKAEHKKHVGTGKFTYNYKSGELKLLRSNLNKIIKDCKLDILINKTIQLISKRYNYYIEKFAFDNE